MGTMTTINTMTTVLPWEGFPSRYQVELFFPDKSSKQISVVASSDEQLQRYIDGAYADCWYSIQVKE
jgi:hypothetical protein